MKKIYLAALLAMSTAAATAQTIDVVFSVDMNGAPAFDGTAGFTAGQNVMRVGGNFQGWNPTANEMTDADGNGVYAVTLPVDLGATGGALLFKFVIDGWGNNEGQGDNTGIADGGCGVDDGAGNINRTVTVEATTTALPTYLYNTCDVSTNPISNVSNLAIANVKVTPNPFKTNAVLSFDDAAQRNISISNAMGQVVRNINSADQSVTIERNGLAAGMYIVTVRDAKGATAAQRIIIE